MNTQEKEFFLSEASKLQEKYELSKTIRPDYFEPGKMEFLDQYGFDFSEETGNGFLRFSAAGTRYGGRPECIENVARGNPISIIRDNNNVLLSKNLQKCA